MNTAELGSLRAEGSTGGLKGQERREPVFLYRTSREEGVLGEAGMDVGRQTLSHTSPVVMARCTEKGTVCIGR